MKKQKCVILGGNGFIGTNLAAYLNNDYQVLSFDLKLPIVHIPYVEYSVFDICEKSDFNKLVDADIIVDLISTINPSSAEENPERGYSTDLFQRIKMLEYLKDRKIKYIFISSGGTVYGNPQKLPVSEEDSTGAIGFYGNIKLAIENIITMYQFRYKMKNIILRVGNPYGPGQDYTKGVGVIDAFVKKAVRKQTITIVGTGETIRDYIHINDVCSAVGKAIKYSGNKLVFNISSGVGTSLNQLLNIIEQCAGTELDLNYIVARKTDVFSIILDCSLAKEELYFTPQITLDIGIKNYFEYIAENLGK